MIGFFVQELLQEALLHTGLPAAVSGRRLVRGGVFLRAAVCSEDASANPVG
jgi:hypothetical protein